MHLERFGEHLCDVLFGEDTHGEGDKVVSDLPAAAAFQAACARDDGAAQDIWLPEFADGALGVTDTEDGLCVCKLPGVQGLAEVG